MSKKLYEVLEKMHFTVPTEIQNEAIPLVLEGRDVIGNAATGSGKTLAFASGIIERCVPGQGIQALVLAPTRELAEQIGKVTRNFAYGSGLQIIEVFGGVSYDNQVRGMRNADVVIGTPGRILDHLKQGTLDLTRIKILVLDEADRMADMGFLRDVETIIKNCNKERQTLLFSATTSQDVKHIEKRYMNNPEHVVVEQYVDASKLKQVYYNVPNHLKFSLLVHLLKGERSGIVLVFCNTRRNVDFIALNLKRYGLFAHAIHGGLEQRKRSRVIESLHNNEANILVCTDVAARGLDIKGVSHVYNYDIPKTSEEYIHRVGRTARAGKEGIAVNLISNRDYENFGNVLKDDSIKVDEVEMPDIEQIGVRFDDSAGERKFGGNRGGQGGGRRFGSGGGGRGRFGSSRGGSREGSRGGSGGFRGRRRY